MELVEGLPDDILTDVPGLAVDRRGDGDAVFMVTHGIVGYIAPGVVYRIGAGGLDSISGERATGEPTALRTVPKTPPCIRLSGEWDNTVAVETDQANIFGDIGTLTLDRDQIVIPEAPATAEALAYYGASLLRQGDDVCFETGVNMPVIRMEIGEGYAAGYLQIASKGGGAYLEHHDQPHLHMALDGDAAGYLLLGRRDGADYLISAFRLPYGCAVYTPPEVLHADAYLTGNYLVVYALTDNFANAVLRSPGGGVVGIDFAALP